MKTFKLMCAGAAGLLLLAGCSTTKSSSAASLENRVQALESRIQVLESDLQSVPVPGDRPASEFLAGKPQSGVTAQSMTKQQIQEALKNAGYYDGEIDGKIGPGTRAAIMDFQKDMGLKVDGIAGRNTKSKLLKYLQ